MPSRSLSTIIFMSLALPALAYVPPADSVYTDLAPARCKTVSVTKENAGSVQRCPGVAGYTLLVEDDDLRQSVTVVAPGGKKYPLHYWQVVTSAFSSVGDKAEWRVEKRKGGRAQPYALIVRVNASENPEKPDEKTSYLAVAKITKAGACVTDKVKTNEEARQAADAAANKPCLKWE